MQNTKCDNSNSARSEMSHDSFQFAKAGLKDFHWPFWVWVKNVTFGLYWQWAERPKLWIPVGAEGEISGFWADVVLHDCLPDYEIICFGQKKKPQKKEKQTILNWAAFACLLLSGFQPFFLNRFLFLSISSKRHLSRWCSQWININIDTSTTPHPRKLEKLQKTCLSLATCPCFVFSMCCFPALQEICEKLRWQIK